jgi:hypothetical protein
MAESDPNRGRAPTWTVKLRLAIDAEAEPEARAIAGEVIQAMDVAVAGELKVTRSASHRPFWNIVTDLDLSAAGNVTPDDALTRFRYVIRNLPGVTFISPRSDDKHSGMYQWLPDEWSTSLNYEELVHPAVRAAGIFVTASPAADTANESSTGTDHQT